MVDLSDVIEVLERAKENKGSSFEERTYFLIEKAEQLLRDYISEGRC